ncbi:MAG: LuxR C-terminal-related transcriptional regulator [Proteobacteria bacterium]|nr:LuxR C-terminal-related transcriptional regulator [Pseudomonadota bacterium]
MAEEKGGSGRIIALLSRAELLLEDSRTGRSNPEEIAEIVHELERHRFELQLQDDKLGRTKNDLQKAHDELEQRVADRTRELEETNIALAVLLNKKRQDTRDLEHQIDANVRSLVDPYLMKLEKGPLSGEQKALVNIIKSNLEEIITPFTRSLSSKFVQLTPTEIQVANLVKQRKRTKDIAELLNLSPGTIHIHRKNIRKKLGLTNHGGQPAVISFIICLIIATKIDFSLLKGR